MRMSRATCGFSADVWISSGHRPPELRPHPRLTNAIAGRSVYLSRMTAASSNRAHPCSFRNRTSAGSRNRPHLRARTASQRARGAFAKSSVEHGRIPRTALASPTSTSSANVAATSW